MEVPDVKVLVPPAPGYVILAVSVAPNACDVQERLIV
jgi:hypothetical protein